MLTNSGLVKKKKISYPRMTARAEGREGEGETLLSLSPAVRDTHTRARACLLTPPVGVPPEGDEPTGHEDESQ